MAKGWHLILKTISDILICKRKEKEIKRKHEGPSEDTLPLYHPGYTSTKKHGPFFSHLTSCVCLENVCYAHIVEWYIQALKDLHSWLIHQTHTSISTWGVMAHANCVICWLGKDQAPGLEETTDVLCELVFSGVTLFHCLRRVKNAGSHRWLCWQDHYQRWHMATHTLTPQRKPAGMTGHMFYAGCPFWLSLGLNHQPQDYKTGALTGYYSRH